MKRRSVGILLLFFAVFLFNASATWAEDGLPDDLPGLEVPSDIAQMPGRIESTGTHFEVKGSTYLNVIADSTEQINLILESMPEMVTLHVGSATEGVISTQITLGGFAPDAIYHKYEDNYHNHVAFTTNAEGKYVYTQDLSVPHVIFIKPRPSTKFIADDATGKDCTSIGLWDSTTKTCTLTTDLNQEIQIDSDGITLNGNGHVLTGSKTGSGVFVTGRSNITIKNIRITGFTNGIYLLSSSSISLINNNASNNSYGIRLDSSDNNTLQDNGTSNNVYGIYFGYIWNYYGSVLSTSDNNILRGNIMTGNSRNFSIMDASLYGLGDSLNQDIDTSNLVDGKPVYFIRNAADQTYDASTNAGIFYCINCNNVTIDGLMINNNYDGIVLYNTNNSTIRNVNVSNSVYGIRLIQSNNNSLMDSSILNNIEFGYNGSDYLYYSYGEGIKLSSSNYNTLARNTARYNRDGIYLSNSNNNTITGNTTSNNYLSGISIYKNSNYNTIIGNTVSDNFNQEIRYLDVAGIAVYSSYNNIVSNNAVSNQGLGISLFGGPNTVSGNHVSNNKNGIYLLGGSDSTIVDNVVESNSFFGIYINLSSRFSLRGNIMTGNNKNFGVRGSSDQALDHNIDTTNLVDGKPIYYIKDASNQTFDASTNAGTFYCINCTNVIIEGLTLTNNYLGILLYKTNNSTIRNVNLLGNFSYGGFGMSYSNNNTVYNNNFYKGSYISNSGGTGNAFNLPAPVGGNYFSNYDTAAEGCNDANGDGFCDAPYVFFGGKDNLPWVKGDGWRSDDTLPPTTTISTSGTSGNNGWYVSNVEATLTASDNEGGSGVAKTEYSFDNVNWNIYTIPFTISSEGTTRIYYKSTDNAGSPESAKSQEIKIDKTPPITSAAIPGTLGNNGWYLSDVTITVTATDSYSGIKEIHYIVDGVENVVSSDTATFTLTVDGVYSIEYWAVDNAGIEGPRGSAPINRDAAAPVTTPITSGTAGSGGYYTSCVTATLQTTGTSSGTSATQYSLDGGQTWQTYTGQFEVCNTGSSDTVTVTYRSISAAGKAEEPKILVIKIDKTPPTIVANISHAPNANGWHNTDVTVTFTCNDPVPGSGVASCQSPITVVTEGEGQIITGTVYDLAGNSATASVTLNIDKTAPIVNINAPFDGAEYTLGQVVTADWSTNDSLSGIDTATATLPNASVVDTSTSGAKTFSVTAVDKAGNVITRTSAYYVRYTYGGVSQPINADGSSIFRFGSTVAVRFKLTDVSGSYITSAVARIYLAKITDNVIGTEEEAVSTSAASTGNQFRYDSTDNQYIFNLSTENMSAGTWQIRIELSDGSSKVAIISVR